MLSAVGRARSNRRGAVFAICFSADGAGWNVRNGQVLPGSWPGASPTVAENVMEPHPWEV